MNRDEIITIVAIPLNIISIIIFVIYFIYIIPMFFLLKLKDDQIRDYYDDFDDQF